MKNIFVISYILSILCLNSALAQPGMEPPFQQPGTGNEPGPEETEKIEFASSPNPVGSGARAMGMGGAFIGVANDATAASWNPGGLIQVRRPEISIVGSWFHRIEDNAFGTNPEANGPQTVSHKDVNYFSASYPFTLFNRSMVVSLNYQHLYEFNREWNLLRTNTSKTTDAEFTTKKDTDYWQTGNLSALGIAYGAKLVRDVSFGFTLNLWDDGAFDNEWEEHFYEMNTEIIKFQEPPPDMPDFMETSNERTRTDHYSFSGFNANIGLLWQRKYRNESRLKIGAVVKLPFTADLTHEWTQENKRNGILYATEEYKKDEHLDMPISYGIGCSYRFSDKLTIAADIYRTEWGDFILTDSDGRERSPITNLSPEESDIDATHQIRLGAEYLCYNEKDPVRIPFRAGIFYDPAPAKGSPDDWYGFTLGSGIQTKYVVFDIAYQYRYGNNVGTSIAPDYDLSQDVDEHTIYLSMIFRFKNKESRIRTVRTEKKVLLTR